jgi:hypothetical protein
MLLIGHTYGTHLWAFHKRLLRSHKTAARCQAILVSVADLFVTYDERFTGLPPRVSSVLLCEEDPTVHSSHQSRIRSAG